MNQFIHAAELFLQTAAQMGTPLLLATTGGILSEKVGNMNLGIEGMMLMGAVGGFWGAVKTGNPLIALLAAGLTGLLGALLYAMVTITLRGNQVVTGLTLTIFGSGFAAFFGQELTAATLPENIKHAFAAKPIPVLSEIPLIGKMFFDQGVYVYLGVILAILAWVYLRKTNWGMNACAVGENPAAADASGINVTLYKYINVLAGGFLCGLGGAYLSVVFVKNWTEGMTAGQGWIAVALIIFSTWNPMKAIFGAYFFGALRGVGFKLQGVKVPLAAGSSFTVSAQLLDMIPYVVTIIALVFIAKRSKKENQSPAALGNPYFREER